MLYYKDFQQIHNDIKPFTFESLKFCSENERGQLYVDNYCTQLMVIKYADIEEVKIINNFALKGLIFNYKGSLQNIVSSQYYVFISLNEYETLSQYIEKHRFEKKLVDQKFCIELIESVLFILKEIQKESQAHLKILNPFSIAINQNSKNKQKLGFGLLLPFPHTFLRCIKKSEFTSNYSYLSPQMISYFETSISSSSEICIKQFRKSSLFSLGLVIMFCFGHTSLNYSKCSRDFKNFFKNVRKEIKVLHKGKYVPKMLKLMLQNSEKVRDTLQTFNIKIHSPQFQSLKTEPFSPLRSIKLTTQVTDKSSHPKLFKTISIQVSHNSSLMMSDFDKNFKEEGLSQKSLPYLNSPINIDVPDDQEQEMEQKKQELQKIEQMQEQDMKKIEDEQNIEDYIIKYNVDQIRYSPNNYEKPTSSIITNNLQEQQIFPQPPPQPEEQPMEQDFNKKSKIIFIFVILSWFFYGAVGFI